MHLAEMRQRKLVEGGSVSWSKQTGYPLSRDGVGRDKRKSQDPCHVARGHYTRIARCEEGRKGLIQRKEAQTHVPGET